MIKSTKAALLLAGICAVAICSLAGCDKAPGAWPTQAQNELAAKLQEPPLPDAAAAVRRDPEAIAMQDKYIQWVVEKAWPAGLREPAYPDPSRTDPAAKIMLQKYLLWGLAETKIANDAALKQQEHFLGLDKPAPKGNYGKMSDGMPTLAADKK